MHSQPLLQPGLHTPLTCPEQDDLVVQGQLREVWDPFGPLHQSEELLVCCLTDVGNRVIWLEWRKDTNQASPLRHPDPTPSPHTKHP